MVNSKAKVKSKQYIICFLSLLIKTLWPIMNFFRLILVGLSMRGIKKSKGNIVIFLLYDWQHC
jgi:hypothetical protein